MCVPHPRPNFTSLRLKTSSVFSGSRPPPSSRPRPLPRAPWRAHPLSCPRRAALFSVTMLTLHPLQHSAATGPHRPSRHPGEHPTPTHTPTPTPTPTPNPNPNPNQVLEPLQAQGGMNALLQLLLRPPPPPIAATCAKLLCRGLGRHRAQATPPATVHAQWVRWMDGCGLSAVRSPYP